MRIGIDFGTTNCSVGRFDISGTPRIIGPIPSVGYWSNGKFEFGHEAVDALRTERRDLHPIRDLKLAVGKDSHFDFGGTKLETQKITAALLSAISQKLDIDDPRDVDQLVLATPVLMNATHRSELIAGASEAGFSNARLVYEPTAALLGATIIDTVPDQATVLVVDWGGGTLDLSVVRVEGQTFREIAVRGEVQSLGGTDMDHEITRRILAEEPSIEAALSTIPGGKVRLAAEIEEEKIRMLEDSNPVDEELIAPEWLGDSIVVIDRETVFEVVDKFTASAIGEIDRMLSSNDLLISDIDHILFAGGTCRCSRIGDRLRDQYPELMELTVGEPQTLTGLGCAMLADRGFVLRLAGDFGVRNSDDSVCVLLPKGVDLLSKNYRTAEFLVTDPAASDATIDLGLSIGGEENNLLHRRVNTFVSLKTFFLTARRRESRTNNPVLDKVFMAAGVSDDLTVTVHAETSISGASWVEKVSGVPLAIKLDSTSDDE